MMGTMVINQLGNPEMQGRVSGYIHHDANIIPHRIISHRRTYAKGTQEGGKKQGHLGNQADLQQGALDYVTPAALCLRRVHPP